MDRLTIERLSVSRATLTNYQETERLLLRAEATDDGYRLDGFDARVSGMQPISIDAEKTSRTRRSEVPPPNMWSMPFIGVYAHYAGLGLMQGQMSVAKAFCRYVYDGPSNLCSNASGLMFFFWNLKILYAIATDNMRPCGMRRKPYILTGWLGILALLLLLSFIATHISAEAWITLSVILQGFLMLADVPCDGYCVELSQYEDPKHKGQILATAHLIRYIFCVVSGLIQSFLLNGPATNKPGCPVAPYSCWSWGLSIQEYYILLFCISLVLFIPMLKIQEVAAGPEHEHKGLVPFLLDLWDTLQNKTTGCILLYGIGMNALAQMPISIATSDLQYYVLNLPNLLAGIDSVAQFAVLSLAIWIFKTYLLTKNWRVTNYVSVIGTALLNLLWILPYYNVAGLRNGWFTIWLDMFQSFTTGLSQILISLSVIELAKPGQEATSYELIISVANSCITVAYIVATQLMTPLDAAGCNTSSCPADTVDLDNFDGSDGPQRFTNYTLVVTAISIAASLLFTPFLPARRAQCHEWKIEGERSGGSQLRGLLALFIIVIIIVYGILGSILLLVPSTSCEVWIGGSGC